MSTSITGGYYLLRSIQLSNLLDAIERKQIHFQAFRMFFAAVSIKATREVAQRVSGKEQLVKYSKSEIQELTQTTTTKAVSSALSSLENIGLLEFSEEQIIVSHKPLTGADDRVLQGGQGRSRNRLIPVPRRILRFLAQCHQPSVAKTIVAYLLRGLTRRRGGEIVAKGSVKSSWIAEVAGISLRAAKAARKKLIQMGWLSEDTNSTQRKLNRTGAYFTINLEWEAPNKATPQGKIVSGSEINAEAKVSKFSPPPTQNGCKFAPPYKNIETLTELKTKKLKSGFLKRQEREPKLHEIQPHDLKYLGRLLKLYEQATAKGWLIASESNLLFFIATAVRVKETECRDPVRVFVAIVRCNLKHHITQDQEDRARYLLRWHREQLPQRSVPENKQQPKSVIAKIGDLVGMMLNKDMHQIAQELS